MPGEGGEIRRKLTGFPVVTADEHARTACRLGNGGTHAGSLYRLKSGDSRRTAAVLCPADELRYLRNGLQLLQEVFHRMPFLLKYGNL